MSCGLLDGTEGLECSGTIQKGFYEAPPKRQLLLEKFGDYARNLEEEAYWVLKYNNLLELDEDNFMTISTIKINGRTFMAHYWPEQNGKFEIMLEEFYKH